MSITFDSSITDVNLGPNYEKLEAKKEFNRCLDNLLSSTSWKQEKITVINIKELIDKNLKLITSRTEEENNRVTQAKLFELSKRIDKEFHDKESVNVAFDIYGIALGLFSEVKPRWSDLPDDVLEFEVFRHMLPKNPKEIKSHLESPMRTSKKWNVLASKAKSNWVNEKAISLKT